MSIKTKILFHLSLPTTFYLKELQKSKKWVAARNLHNLFFSQAWDFHLTWHHLNPLAFKCATGVTIIVHSLSRIPRQIISTQIASVFNQYPKYF